MYLMFTPKQDEMGYYIERFDTKQKLIEEINERGEGTTITYSTTLPKLFDDDLQCAMIAKNQVMILKVELVVPKEVTKTVEYDID